MINHYRKTISLLSSALILTSCTTTPKTTKETPRVHDSRKVTIGDRMRSNGITGDLFDEDQEKQDSTRNQKRNRKKQIPGNMTTDKGSQPDRESANELLKALSGLQ